MNQMEQYVEFVTPTFKIQLGVCFCLTASFSFLLKSYFTLLYIYGFEFVDDDRL